jgi:hypothetical protein
VRAEGTKRPRQCRDIKLSPAIGGPFGKSVLVFVKLERAVQHGPGITAIEVSLSQAKQLRKQLDWSIHRLEHPVYAEEGGGK